MDNQEQTTLNKELSIRPLRPLDANTIAAFLHSQPAEYMRFFYALDSDEHKISRTLAEAREDVYSGLFWQRELVGIFMLRGWDEGFDTPSFGVLIDERFRGGALMRLTLDAAKVICKLSGCKRLMAKIHPENVGPRGARRLGLLQTGVEESTGNIVYHMEI